LRKKIAFILIAGFAIILMADSPIQFHNDSVDTYNLYVVVEEF
jgi:hypothetical protein